MLRYASAAPGILAFPALAGVAFIYSGLYNVAATTPHTRFVWWALDTLKERSVKHRGNAIRAPVIDDAAAARAAGKDSAVPGLAGQPAPYLVLQPRLWKSGVRTDAPIMREIAARLSNQPIVDLAE